MGFTEILTLIFVVLKCLGIITWSWWVVFSPELVALVFYVIISIIVWHHHRNIEKNFNKYFD